MTGARWALVLGGIGFVTVAVACLNPQPLPPMDAVEETDDAATGATFGGGDSGASTGGDAALSETPTGSDAGDAGDAGDGGDAGDAGTDGGDAGRG